jgi:hypothetical protein
VWVRGRSLAGVAGSNFARDHSCLTLVSDVCQLEVSERGRSLVQWRPAESNVSEYDLVKPR